jgi:segregation and condensation protein B
VSKRKKTSNAPVEVVEDLPLHEDHKESVTTQVAIDPDLVERALEGEGSPLGDDPGEPAEAEPAPLSAEDLDPEMTVNLAGSDLPLPGRDDLDAPTVAATGEELQELDGLLVQRKHLKGLLEALIFASDSPIKPGELAKLASAQAKQVKELLVELKHDFSTRGVHLDEVAGGWVFRTSAQYAPFIRDLTKQKPVRLTRAQVETLAIIAYRQPITRPEVDDVRGVDSGPVLKLLLERDLVRILGKRDEPGRPLIYGTTGHFLEFFGLRSLKDLPTLREFTELTDESRQTYEDELGETPHEGPQPDGEPATEAHEDDASAPPETDERGPSESMRIPIGDAIPDELEETHAAERHEADRDDPTITTGAPARAEEDDAQPD